MVNMESMATEAWRNNLVSKLHQRALTAERKATVGQSDLKLSKELQVALQQAEERARAAEEFARLARDERRKTAVMIQRAEEEAQIAEQEAVIIKQAKLEAEKVAYQAKRRAELAGEMCRNAIARAESAEERIASAERRAMDMERRATEEAPFWALQTEEIELTSTELGRGGWAVVKIAYFRGLQVAAKVLHSQILSDYNRDLFLREMSMAARLRHPNLLQFIGATIKGQPIILTELMPESLRGLLERKSIKRNQIVSISFDVVRALNYLHLMKPDAIIHRDISSANVLLESTGNDKWKAKLADFGSANFFRQITTAGPGNPSYSAPEASVPTMQSPKMDIFSFGIMLLEMCTCRFPAEAHHERLLQTVQDPSMKRLIKNCTDHNRDNRPTAANIIQTLRHI